MRNVLLIASKEIQENLRNRWVLATTLLLAALALTLSCSEVLPLVLWACGSSTW